MAMSNLDYVNPIKEKLRKGEPSIGLFFLSGSPVVAEVCATTDLDWIVLDIEGSPLSHGNILYLLQALNGSTVCPIIRVQRNEHSEIEHALDLGAFGVIVPKIDTQEAAAKTVAASFYPPIGRRGINPVRASGYFQDVPGYLKSANERTLCIVQIESRQAIKNVRSIAGLYGVDMLFIGPGDLANSLGQPGVMTGPKFDKARRTVLEAAQKAKKAAGIFAYTLDLAHQYIEEGFLFVAIGNDLKLLKSSISESIDAVMHRRSDSKE